MIVGLGMDLVEIGRIARAMENPRFLRRILTPEERLLCRTPERVAGRFAAKEAIAKALGVSITWQQIEIVNDPFGAPRAHIISQAFDPHRLRMHVTITHERGHAAAVAVLERLVMQAPTF